MRGYGSTSSSSGDTFFKALSDWEEWAVNAVGRVIEFWGFKENYGRIWALLYIRDEPMTAADIQQTFGLSKGAVSMLLQDLEQWKVIARVQNPGGRARLYAAESSFIKMMKRVVNERELELIDGVEKDLVDAIARARKDDARPRQLERLQAMRRLAGTARQALGLVLKLTEKHNP